MYHALKLKLQAVRLLALHRINIINTMDHLSEGIFLLPVRSESASVRISLSLSSSSSARARHAFAVDTVSEIDSVAVNARCRSIIYAILQ